MTENISFNSECCLQPDASHLKLVSLTMSLKVVNKFLIKTDLTVVFDEILIRTEVLVRIPYSQNY